MTILDKITEYKKEELILQKKVLPIDELKDREYYQRSCTSLSKELSIGSFGIVAEFKRKSPSKQNINISAQVENVVPYYEKAGARAVSVLTDQHFFGGTLEDLRQARELLNIPILRKDFIIDSYQVHEAKANGADLVLLIASCLTKNQVIELAQEARSIGLEVLLELHGEEELTYVTQDIDIVGINNRNLKTFEVNLEQSIRMSHYLGNDHPKISESGLKSEKEIVRLSNEGFNGFLIGETFMKTDNPGKACSELIYQLNKHKVEL